LKMFGEMDEDRLNASSEVAASEPTSLPEVGPGKDNENHLLQTAAFEDPSGAQAVGIGPVLTTSGFLANQHPVMGSEPNASKGASPFQNDYMNDAGISNDFTFTEEFPLWSILNDFDPLLDAEPEASIPG